VADRKPISAEVRDSFPTVRNYLDMDSHPVPEALLETSSPDLGNEPIEKSVFTSRDYADLEEAHVWKRTWQLACRENDIPAIGDRIVYDVLDQSFVIVRAQSGIKAFYNVCMHRGTRLVGEHDPLSGTEFACSFHNWKYKLDGSLKRIPCRWDFPNVQDKQVHLTEVPVGTWNGFVFINMDPNCESFAEFIGETIPRHFKSWPYDNAAKIGHFAKVLPCNWKVAVGAFLEVYHVNQTHAGIMSISGDCNSQYDSWGEHARQIMCIGVPSPHLGDMSEDAQMIVDDWLDSAIVGTFGAEALKVPELPEGAGIKEVRQLCAEISRKTRKEKLGIDYSDASDTEMLDSIQYFIFPNFFLFGGRNFPLGYRILPLRGDHESCIFEVMAMLHMPAGAPLPKDVPLKMTPADEPWEALQASFGKGVAVFDQDQANLVKFQAGLRQNGLKQVHLANYQERNIRNFLLSVERRIWAGQKKRSAGTGASDRAPHHG
jgi:nitrite reductase/ring-hydroxylating ferredoxin subunit